jgi:hypothetical protein
MGVQGPLPAPCVRLEVAARDPAGEGSGNGSVTDTRERIRTVVAGETFGERFVTKVLGRELGL